jgi:hypothetical protein
MKRRFGQHAFDMVGEVHPDRDDADCIIEHAHSLGAVRLNPHGKGPFCNFRLPGAGTATGVYVVDVQGQVV